MEPTHSKAMLWTGRVISALIVAMLLFSAALKLNKTMVLEEFTRLGYPESTILGIAIAEIACAVIYAVPQTAVLGAILATGYLGGATATHVRVGDVFISPIIVGVLVWLGLFLRDARVRALVPWRRV